MLESSKHKNPEPTSKSWNCASFREVCNRYLFMMPPTANLLVVYLLFLFCLCQMTVGEQGQVGVINDEYCDFGDGSDEPLTSACSHLPIAFNCKGNGNKGVTNVTIPASRVNDGVCDCCDGSDETSPNHAPCRNICEAEWAEERKKALSMYRNIQSGMRARTEVTEAFKLARTKEVKQIDKLKTEYETIDKMLFRMMLLLQREEKREKQLRFSLIREREARCAEGVVTACEYFTPGYFDDDELLYEGYPLEYANPQKRFHYVHSQAEIDQLAKLSGLERVKLAICTTKDLLPDDDARIFTQLGEYMTFANSPGGKISREATSPHKRKLNTLFGRFLENGDKGFLQGQLLLLEWAGLLISPVTLSMRLLGYLTQRAGQSLWHATQQCASGYTSPDKSDVSQQSNSVGYPTSVAHVCKLILDSDVEGSQVANVLTVLDYTRYSFVMTTIDIWSGYLSTPMWIWEVVYRAPVMYFDYYIMGRSNQLPPRRQCCLLRNGIDSARTELQTLQQRIATQEELVHQSALRRYAKFVHSDNSEETGRKKLSKRRANKNEVLVPLDFGPEGSWESVVNNCLERDEGAHSYSFCFFGEIKQDGVVSLGRFAHWDASPTAPVQAASYGGETVSVDVDGAGTGESSSSTDRAEQAFTPPPPPRSALADRAPGHMSIDADSDVPTNPIFWLREALQPALEQTAVFWAYLAQENKISGASPGLNKLLATGSKFFESTLSTRSTDTVRGSSGSSTEGAGAATSSATPAYVDTARYSDDPALQQAYYGRQRYDGGTACYPRQGMPRRTEVLFECGMSSAITEIVETEVCVYKFVISTPLVCTKHLESTALQRLDNLGVFGFSSGTSDASKRDTKSGSSGATKGRKPGKMNTQGRSN